MLSLQQANINLGAEPSILDEFRRVVATYPDSIALEFDQGRWSYSELDDYSNRVANGLIKGGAGPDLAVGVFLQRSPELIGVLLGVLKAGSFYLSLDPTYPRERIHFMLADCRAKLIVTSNANTTLDGCFPPEAQVVPLRNLEKESSESPECFVSGRDLAYILYTSGSTGTPKGSLIEHRSVVNLVAKQSCFTITPRDVFFQLTSPSFDVSVFEVFAALLHGAKLVIPPPGNLTIGDIAQLLDRYSVSVLWLTSGLFNAVIDEQPESVGNLRLLLAGGDVLSPEHVGRALQYLTHGSLINGYGPTECSVFSTYHRIQPSDLRRPSIPIGKPLDGVCIRILDEHMKEVLPGQEGELYIGGEGVARGYWNRPELNAERFLPDPFSQPEARLYKSGDLGAVDENGVLEFHGRSDTQIKVRGFRVELSEVESAINTLECVRACAVVVKGERADQKLLCCYYVPRENQPATVGKLRALLAAKLPDYMIPSQFVPLPSLPLTNNGKYDRKLLVARGDALSVVASKPIEGLTEIERTLSEMWQSLLGVPAVGLDDDFFELGGTSLTAARLLARVKQHFGVNLPLSFILKASTVRRLAKAIATNEDHDLHSALVLLNPESKGSTALFLVHPIGGHVLIYRSLAERLNEYKVYGLQFRPNHQSTNGNVVEEIARVYVEAVKSVQPTGPYHIGGFSAGGVIAFEMSRLLQTSGETLALLALVDTTAEPGLRRLLKDAHVTRALRRFARVFAFNMHLCSSVGLHRFLSMKAKNAKMNFRLAAFGFSSSLKRHVPWLPGFELKIEETLLNAIDNYGPSPLKGRATLFRTADSLRYNEDQTLGWRQLFSDGVDVEDVPGNHLNMLLEPQVDEFARKLLTALSEGRKRTFSSDSFTTQRFKTAELEAMDPSQMPPQARRHLLPDLP